MVISDEVHNFETTKSTFARSERIHAFIGRIFIKITVRYIVKKYQFTFNMNEAISVTSY